MMYKTHLVFAIFIFLLLYVFFEISSPLLFLIMILFGALFCDIDSPNSKFGKKIWPFSLFLKHRGIFHSFFILFFISLILHLIFLNNIITIGFVIGFLSHLFLDALNYAGVRPLYPILNIEIKGVIKTNSFEELIIFVLLSGIVLFQSYYLFLSPILHPII